MEGDENKKWPFATCTQPELKVTLKDDDTYSLLKACDWRFNIIKDII